MVDLLNDLDKYTKLHKNLKDIKLAIVICTEYMDDTRNTVNNALDRVKTKLTLLNLELKNYEDSVKLDLQEGGHNGSRTTG